jgi:putative transposase
MVCRIYCELVLNVRIKSKKRRKREKAEPLMVPENINECWSMDFTRDQFSDGRSLRLMNVIDYFDREALAIEVDFRYLPVVSYKRSSNSLSGKENR